MLTNSYNRDHLESPRPLDSGVPEDSLHSSSEVSFASLTKPSVAPSALPAVCSLGFRNSKREFATPLQVYSSVP